MRLTPRLLPLLVACAPLAGCTAIILNDASGAALPCEDASDCTSGQRCEDEACVDDDRDAQAPGAPEIVGPSGGLVPGPDGFSIEIPPGALDNETTFTIVRESSTTPMGDLLARSRVFRVSPQVSLDDAVTVFIDIEESCASCAIYHEDGGAFVALPEAESAAGVVAGRAVELGVFVAAQEAP